MLVNDLRHGDDEAAVALLAAAHLVHVAPTLGGDPVARFHLDNGARLERLNPHGNLSPAGLKQSFGMMFNYLYDLDKVEAHHARFRQGEMDHARRLGTNFPGARPAP
jgi:malonyl-CoA decarboxylase